MAKVKCHERGRMPEPESKSTSFLFPFFLVPISCIGLVCTVGKIGISHIGTHHWYWYCDLCTW